jgi:hypothetical protein
MAAGRIHSGVTTRRDRKACRSKNSLLTEFETWTLAYRGIQASNSVSCAGRSKEQRLLRGEIKRAFYELLIPSIYSLLSEAAAKESTSTNVLADSRIEGVDIFSLITR